LIEAPSLNRYRSEALVSGSKQSGRGAMGKARATVPYTRGTREKPLLSDGIASVAL
jgi:hypothetical protein